MDRTSDDFVRLLTASQPGLYACILSLVPDRTAAQDILQETNVTLWHKADDFEPGTNFMAWAARIARYHVLNFRRKAKRERLVFDDQLIAELCSRQEDRAEDAGHYSARLQHCLEKLSDEHRELLAMRYAPGGSVQELAASRGQTVGAVSQLLYRIRESLLNCLSQPALGDGT
ncbi:MAG TPA: sigma-70 family RNA polymerase sigma factor [Caulifigura sp.]|nr:sigma-70 family RNA polymerase sigma factor [Caulifigura sp.]